MAIKINNNSISSVHCNNNTISEVKYDGNSLLSVTGIFYISSVQYSFEIGMTWYDWINSVYNTDGYYIDDNYVCLNSREAVGMFVCDFTRPEDLIYENTYYYTYDPSFCN